MGSDGDKEGENLNDGFMSLGEYIFPRELITEIRNWSVHEITCTMVYTLLRHMNCRHAMNRKCVCVCGAVIVSTMAMTANTRNSVRWLLRQIEIFSVSVENRRNVSDLLRHRHWVILRITYIIVCSTDNGYGRPKSKTDMLWCSTGMSTVNWSVRSNGQWRPWRQNEFSVGASQRIWWNEMRSRWNECRWMKWMMMMNRSI